MSLDMTLLRALALWYISVRPLPLAVALVASKNTCASIAVSIMSTVTAVEHLYERHAALSAHCAIHQNAPTMVSYVFRSDVLTEAGCRGLLVGIGRVE